MDHGSDATIVEYEPYEVGPHIIKIVHEEAHIVGSPFTCNVYDANKVEICSLLPLILTFMKPSEQSRF